MKLAAANYRAAARTRLDEARCLYGGRFWAGTTYLAGRGAEAILRGLLALREPRLESGHDLRDLLARVRRTGMLRERNDAELENAVNEVAVVWRNNLRFADDDLFRWLLRQQKRDRSIGRTPVKGEPEKANAKSVLEACERIISRGDLLWKRLQSNSEK